MSKKSMAARRQTQAAREGSRSGGGRQGGGARSSARSYRRNERSSRRPWGLISAVVGVVAVFIVVVLVLESSLNGGLHQDTTVSPAPASLVSALTSIPIKTLEAVKGGAIDNPPQVLPASAKAAQLTDGDLPQLAFVGAEYCPFCALQRWSLIIGLSHFGSWTGIHTIRSSVYDTPANVPTFSFAYGTKFKSSYLSLYMRELQSNVSINQNGSPYKNLQTVSGDVETAFTTIGGGGYPFLDYGGKLAQAGSEAPAADISQMSNLSWDQVLSALRNPKSTIAKIVLGGANYVTAATCVLTADKPGSICDNSMVKALQKKVESSQ